MSAVAVAVVKIKASGNFHFKFFLVLHIFSVMPVALQNLL